MAFCSNCGSQVVDGAKFCQKCGAPVASTSAKPQNQRQQEFEGKIYKCPNCGETLRSFVRNCPTCGFELRGVKATNAVREFALKLEAIESRREYEKPRGIFSKAANADRISKADEQKINLIQSFSVPNTKEDMLEFMILATSNLDSSLYGQTDTNNDKARKAIADAWLSKIKQVYAKAKSSYGNDEDFARIEELYRNCDVELGKQKKKKTFKLVLLFGWLPLLLVLEIIFIPMLYRSQNAKEENRLTAIVTEVEEAMNEGDYKLALLNAESMEYGGSDKERERWWGIKRETLIDDIIDEAEKNGVHLEKNTNESSDDSEEESTSGGFVEGFKEGMQPGLDAAKENIDEFNRIMDEGTNSDSSTNDAD